MTGPDGPPRSWAERGPPVSWVPLARAGAATSRSRGPASVGDRDSLTSPARRPAGRLVSGPPSSVAWTQDQLPQPSLVALHDPSGFAVAPAHMSLRGPGDRRRPEGGVLRATVSSLGSGRSVPGVFEARNHHPPGRRRPGQGSTPGLALTGPGYTRRHR